MSMLMLLVVVSGGWAGGQPEEPPVARSRHAPDRAGEPPDLEAKLDMILQRQEEILRRLDEVMEELRIVKVRATLK